MEKKKVWYITGASKGMGLALVKELLLQGHQVAATSRSLPALLRATSADALAMDPAGTGPSSSFLPLEVDLTRETSVAASLQLTQQRFGRIDVIVNNAGYGTGGALEELSEAEIEDNFDVNLLAVIRVIRQAMPYLRARRAGHIINISSIAGFAPGTGWTAYAAAKFAVTGLSEALANDLKPLGIRVTAVSPGWFRTRFASEGSIALAKTTLADYPAIRESHERMSGMDGKQLGDPAKVAAALLKLVGHPHPPANLFLGSDAFARAAAKVQQTAAEMQAWKDVSVSTDFAEE